MIRKTAWAAGAAFIVGLLAALPLAARVRPSVRGAETGIPPVASLMRSAQLVEAERADLPPSGTATLRDLFGWRAALAIRSAVGGRYADERTPCRYERGERTTRIWLPALAGSEGESPRPVDGSVPGWTLDVDNRTGALARSPGLPDLSAGEVLGIALPVHRANPAPARLVRGGAAVRALLGTRSPLTGFDCRGVRAQRIGDRVKFHWSGTFPEGVPEDDSAVRVVYWIDLATRSVVDSAVEVRGRAVSFP